MTRWGWLVLLLLASPVAAQPAPDPHCPPRQPVVIVSPTTVLFGQPFQVLGDQDGLTCDIIDPPVPLVVTAANCLFDEMPGVVSGFAVPGVVQSIPSPTRTLTYSLTCPGPTTLAVGTHHLQMQVISVNNTENFSDILAFDVVVPPPPPTFCRYIKPGDTVVQTLAAGTHVRGINQIATQILRSPILWSWGFKITYDPRTPNPGVTVLTDAECVGLQ